MSEPEEREKWAAAARERTHIVQAELARCRAAHADAVERAAAAEAERDEALRHLAGPFPTPELIAQMHSRLPAEWFQQPTGYASAANGGRGHFAYHQAAEACYVCALLGLLERAEAERDEWKKMTGELADFVREGQDHESHKRACAARRTVWLTAEGRPSCDCGLDAALASYDEKAGA